MRPRLRQRGAGPDDQQLSSAKAQLYQHPDEVVGSRLGTITALSYNTFHDSDTTGFVNGNAALQLVIDYNGGDFDDGGFTTSPTSRTSTAPRAALTSSAAVWQRPTEGQLVHLQEITCGEYSLPSVKASAVIDSWPRSRPAARTPSSVRSV